MASMKKKLSDLSIAEQVEHLKRYFRGFRLKISREQHSIEYDLLEIINVYDVCFGVEGPIAIQFILNSIISIILSIPVESSKDLILAFCSKLINITNNALAEICFYPLSNLLNKLNPYALIRYDVYYCLIVLAEKCNRINEVFTSVEQFKAQFILCSENSVDSIQKIYRLLYDILCFTHGELSGQIMIELIGTYKGSLAYTNNARDDAIKCVLIALTDPFSFAVDQLLKYKPIRLLKGELIYELFMIFMKKNLSGYMKFHKDHKYLMDFYGLKHLQNKRNLRLLKFMDLAKTNCEMSYDELAMELKLRDNQIKNLIRCGLHTALIKGHLDEVNRKVFVSSRMHSDEYKDLAMEEDHFYEDDFTDLCWKY